MIICKLKIDSMITMRLLGWKKLASNVIKIQSKFSIYALYPENRDPCSLIKKNQKRSINNEKSKAENSSTLSPKSSI